MRQGVCAARGGVAEVFNSWVERNAEAGAAAFGPGALARVVNRRVCVCAGVPDSGGQNQPGCAPIQDAPIQDAPTQDAPIQDAPIQDVDGDTEAQRATRITGDSDHWRLGLWRLGGSDYGTRITACPDPGDSDHW